MYSSRSAGSSVLRSKRDSCSQRARAPITRSMASLTLARMGVTW